MVNKSRNMKKLRSTNLFNSLFAIVVLSLTVWTIFSTVSCSDNRTRSELKEELPIDSFKLKADHLIEKYGCDTSRLFNSDVFEYQRNEVLRNLGKPLLIEIILEEISEFNDSICIVEGMPFWGVAPEITLVHFYADKALLDNLKPYKSTICIISNAQIKHMIEARYMEDESSFFDGFKFVPVLQADCFHIEQ